MMHKFKAKMLENGCVETFIDDKKVRLSTCDVRFRPDEVPTVKAEFMSGGEIECQCMLDLTEDEIFHMVKDKMIKDPVFRMRVLKKAKELEQADQAKIVADFTKAGCEI